MNVVAVVKVGVIHALAGVGATPGRPSASANWGK